MREKPSETASRPAASGARSSRAVSAPRTIVASCRSAGVSSPNSSSMVSKVQVSPRWLQNTPSMSNGVALNRSATAEHLGRRHEQEHGVRIDEAADQPRAGDAIDLRARPRHPNGAALRVARRQLVGAHERLTGRSPGLEAAFQRFGRDALMAQPCGDTLAELAAPAGR